MKVTLNKAIKFRNKLDSLIVPINFCAEITIDEDLKKIEASYDLACKEKNDEYSLLNQIIEANYKLRSIISQANKEAGIDHVLNKISLMERKISVFKNNESQYYPSVSRERWMNDYFYELKSSVSEEKAFKHKYVEATIEEAVKKRDEDLSALRKSIDSLTEERQRLNYSTLVEIPKDVIEALNRANII
jgi:vacuolar-type H+-ATPase subunit I/STV1